MQKYAKAAVALTEGEELRIETNGSTSSWRLRFEVEYKTGEATGTTRKKNATEIRL